MQKLNRPAALPALRYVQLFPTMRCNQRCFFCFNGTPFKPHSSDKVSPMTDMSFREAMELLHILADRGTGEVDVMGGEPLLLPWIPDFAKSAGKMGIRINISSNGSCLDNIVKLKDADPEKITVGLSLEGSSEEKHNVITGSNHYSLVLEALDTLVAHNLNVVVKTVVSRTTVPDIPNIIRLLRMMGIRRYYLIHMDILTKDPATMKEALSFPDFRIFCDHMRDTNSHMEISGVSASCFTKELIGRPSRCSGGVNKLSILPDGSAFPCNLFHRFPEFRLGNILEEDFSSLWANSRLDTFRTPPGGPCDDTLCINRSSCTGGCPAHCYYHHGNLHGRDVRCGLSPASG